MDVAVASYLSSSDCRHSDGLEAERSRTGATFFGPVVAMRHDVHVHDNRVDEEDRYLYCRRQCHGRVFVPPPSSIGRLEPIERLVHRILFLDTSLWKRLCIPHRYSKKILLCVQLYTLRRVPIKKTQQKKCVILHHTHPPDPLPLTIVQWCIILSHSSIGVVFVVIAPRQIGGCSAVAVVAPLPPCRRQPPLARRWHHQLPQGLAPLPALPFLASAMVCP